MKKKQSKAPVKEFFTRAEILTAVADVYRREQEQYHWMAEQAQAALENGEAADYASMDRQARTQEKLLEGIRKAVGTLGIPLTELNAAANAGKEVE